MSHARRPGRPWHKVLKHRVAFALIVSTYAVLSRLPERVVFALGALMGRLLCLTPLYRMARNNIVKAYGDQPPSTEFPTADALARGCLMHYGRLFSEMLLLDRWQPHFLDHCTDKDRLRAMAIRVMSAGRGALLATGHVGNWEVFGRAIAAGGYPVMALARAAFSPEVAAWLVRWRARGGVMVANRGAGNTVRAIRDISKANAGLGVLVDVDTKVKSVWVPFFGHLAKTPTAAADLALKLGTPLMVTWSWRDANGQFSADAVEVPLPDPPPGDEDRPRVVKDLTAKVTVLLEQAIRLHPEQWIWTHRRWRTPPPADGGDAAG